MAVLDYNIKLYVLICEKEEDYRRCLIKLDDILETTLYKRYFL